MILRPNVDTNRKKKNRQREQQEGKNQMIWSIFFFLLYFGKGKNLRNVLEFMMGWHCNHSGSNMATDRSTSKPAMSAYHDDDHEMRKIERIASSGSKIDWQ